MDQMFLANSASTLPQRCPPLAYLGSTPSGTLTGIPHLSYFLTAGFAHGNNYIGVVNIKQYIIAQEIWPWSDHQFHMPVHQQDDILLEVLEIALLALLVPNFSQLELVTYIVVDNLVLDLELEKN
jgi:hypothetical protein